MHRFAGIHEGQEGVKQLSTTLERALKRGDRYEHMQGPLVAGATAQCVASHL